MSLGEKMDVVPKVRFKKTKFSALWNHFFDNGSNLATCNWCSKTLSYKGGSIFNLRRHLHLQHPTVPYWSERSKISRIVKISPAGEEKANAMPSKQISQNISTEVNCEGEPNVVEGEPDHWKTQRRQIEGVKEMTHDLDMGQETFVSESLKEVHENCGGASLGLMESELLKMAREEHKTKMEILHLKKRYLELKVSRLEKGNAE